MLKFNFPTQFIKAVIGLYTACRVTAYQVRVINRPEILKECYADSIYTMTSKLFHQEVIWLPSLILLNVLQCYSSVAYSKIDNMSYQTIHTQYLLIFGAC